MDNETFELCALDVDRLLAGAGGNVSLMKGLEGSAPDHRRPGLEDAFHRSTNGST